MKPLLTFLSHTRLWILPAGLLWLFLLGMHLELGFLRFETIDALYYRELAKDFISGNPMVLDGLLNEKGNPFSPYPPGYPVLLGLTAQIGGGSFDWPVHIILHACLTLLLLVLWQDRLSLLPLAVVLFSDSVLTLAASGISEFSFLVFCILTVFSLTRLQFSPQPGWQIILIISMAATLLLRYAGVFLLPFFLYRWFVLYQQSREKASVLLFPFLLYMLLAAMLFGSQWADTGLLSGGDRYANSDSSARLFLSLITELLNQICIFRDFSGSSWLSFLFAAILNGLFLWMIFRKGNAESELYLAAFQDENHDFFRMELSRNLMIAGMLYLLFIIALRWFYYFAEFFDNRLLAPGACLLWLGLLVKQEKEISSLSFPVKIFYILTAAVFFIPWKALF